MKLTSILIYLFIFPALTFSQTLYQKIQKEKKIIIGISKNYPPLNYLEENVRVGIEIEMINNLAEYLDVKVEIIPLEISDYINALETGRVDILIGGLSRSIERSKKIWFSIPYLKINPAALVDKRILRKTEFGEDIEERPIQNLLELKKFNNLEYAVKKGSIYIEFIENEFTVKNFKSVSTNEEALALLFDYKVNVFIHDSLYLEYVIKDNPGIEKSFTLLKSMDREEYLCIGIPFGEYILKNQLNLWIDELIRTGKLEKWINEYKYHDK